MAYYRNSRRATGSSKRVRVTRKPGKFVGARFIRKKKTRPRKKP